MDTVRSKNLPFLIAVALTLVGFLYFLVTIRDQEDLSALRVISPQAKLSLSGNTTYYENHIEEKVEATLVPEDLIPTQMGEWAQFSQTEALKYFVEFELQSMKGYTAKSAKCNRSYLYGQCCLGSMTGGGSSSWQPTLSSCGISSKIPVPYFTHWKTNQMHDFSKIGEALANDSRITLVGDSIQNQMYEALLCAMLRRDEWTVLNQSDSGRVWQRCCYGMARVLNTTLVHTKSEKVLHVDLYREYKMSYKTILTDVCAISDVVVFSYGIHMNSQSNHKLREVPSIASTIRKCLLKFPKLTVIWRETTPQHFLQPGGHWKMYSKKFPPATNVRPKDFLANVSDSLGYNKSCEDWDCQSEVTQRNMKCTKISYLDEDLERNWRGKEVYKQFKKVFSLSVTSTLTEDSKKSEHDFSRPRVYFIPVFDLFEPLWNFHPGECTHYCYTPLIWQPVLSDIFKAVKDSAVHVGSLE